MAESALRAQKGFTLIELLAVMAIVSVLAGIISISVAGSGQTSRDTQSRQDATSVESALASYFGSRDNAEVLSFKVATVLGRIEVRQVISTSWPENFISDAYPKVFPEGAISTVGSVTFLDSDGTLSDLTARGLLQGFDAIDFDALFDDGFLTTIPKNVSEFSQDVSNYLWLLEKSTTAGGTGTVASREVAVFKLTSVREIAYSDLVDITYRLLFGGDFSDQHPVASNQPVTTDEDTPISVTLSATDLESCELTFLIEEQPSDGVLTSIFDNLCVPGEPNTDSASVIYVPDLNFNGVDSFTYSVIDGNGDDIGTITVTINVVNDAPSFTIPTLNRSISVDEDSGLQIVTEWATDISAGPANEEQSLTFILSTDVSPNALFSVQPAVTSTGTLTYTPALNANGSATITVELQDSGGGLDTSAGEPFTIIVNAVNDPPDALNDLAEVAEDSANNVIDVLSNDTIAPDTGETLTVVGVTQGANGTVTIAGSGKEVLYTANVDFFGDDSFTYTINDGTVGSDDTATVDVAVTVVNDPPDALNDLAEVAEDSVNNVIDVLSNDTIAPDTGETLTLVAVTQGTNGAVAIGAGGTHVLYTPNVDFFGDDSFTYTINDGTAGSDDTATVSVTVNAVPESIDEDFSGSLSSDLQDADTAYTIAGGTISKTIFNNNADRHYIRTVDVNYIDNDFVAQLTFTLTDLPGADFAIHYFGLGPGIQGSVFNESPGVTFRIHSSDIVGGNVDAGVRFPDGTFTGAPLGIGNITTSGGTHRARITKSGNQVEFAIDVDFNGTLTPDITSQIADLAAAAPFLNNTNSRIYFGTASATDVFDDLLITVTP